jgi:hypothetical protein
MGFISATGLSIKAGFISFFKFCADIMSENGSPSSTRFLMVAFSFATIRVIFLIVHHLTSLKDIGLLSAWLGNLPLIIASMIGLISTPYAINRGTASLASIANLVTGVKGGQQVADPVTTKTDSVTVATTTATSVPSSTPVSPLPRSN